MLNNEVETVLVTHSPSTNPTTHTGQVEVIETKKNNENKTKQVHGRVKG